MRTLATIAMLIAGVLLFIFVSAAILILLALGLAWLMLRAVPLSQFEALLLALLAIVPIALLVLNLLFNASSLLLNAPANDEAETAESEEIEIEVEPMIPRWRIPRGPVKYSNVGPNDRCPCGSGKKYKNCHGLSSQ